MKYRADRIGNGDGINSDDSLGACSFYTDFRKLAFIFTHYTTFFMVLKQTFERFLDFY